MPDFTEVLNKALPAIRKASDFIKSQIDQVSSDDIEEKELNSLVSYVDKEAEKILVQGLDGLIPGSGFLTEEDTDDLTGGKYTWIIDPLDGTTNFLNKVPHFGVSVALQHENDLVLGVVKEVNSGDEWTAVKGKGAYMNGTQTSVNSKPFYDILVATGFPYSNDHDYEAYFKILKEWLTRTRGLRRFGSAALDLCFVACGRYGAYYEATLNAWDVAAGTLIAQEAGAIVSDFSGKNDYLFGREIIAASPKVYDEVLNVIQNGLDLN